METSVIEVKFLDGRVYRIFTANKSQTDRVINLLFKIRDKIESWNVLSNGIHTVKEFIEISKHL